MNSINDQNIEICGNLNNFNSIRDFYQCDQNNTCDIEQKLCLNNDSIDSSYDQVEIDSSHGDKYTYAGSSKNIKKLKEKFNSLKNDNFISNQIIIESPYDIGIGIPYISPLSTFINSFIHLLRSIPETFDYDLLKKLRKVYSNDIINMNLIKLLQSIDPNSEDYCFKGLTKNLIMDFLSSYSNNKSNLNDQDIINIINQIINTINDNTKLNLFDICSFQLSKSIFIKDNNSNCILIPNKTFFYNQNILNLNKNDLTIDKKLNLNDIINNYLSLHSFSSDSFEIDSDVKKLLSINKNISINQNNSINLCDLLTIENIKNYFLIKLNESIPIPSDLFNSIQIKNKYGNHILSPTSIILYSDKFKEFINLSLRLNDSKQYVWVLYNNENIQLFDFKDSNSTKKLFKLINNFHPLMILYKKESLKENTLKFLNSLNELQFKSILFNIISKNENIFSNIDDNEYLTEKLYKYIFKLYNKSDIEPNISNEPFNYQTIKNIITLYNSLSSSEKKKVLKEYNKNILSFEDPIEDFSQFIQQKNILKDKDMDDKLNKDTSIKKMKESSDIIKKLINSLEKSCSLDRDPNFSKSDLENIDLKFNLQIAKRISVANFKKLKRQEQCKLVLNELKKLIIDDSGVSSEQKDSSLSKKTSKVIEPKIQEKDTGNILSTFNILNDIYMKLQDNCEKKFNINQLKQIIIDFNLGDIPLKNKSQICFDIKSKIKSKLEDINLIIENSKNILKPSLKEDYIPVREENEIKIDKEIDEENKKVLNVIQDELKKEDLKIKPEIDFEQERINELQKLLEDEEKEIKKKEKDVLKLFPISEVSFVKDEEFDKGLALYKNKDIPQVKQDIKQDIKEIEPIIGKIKIKTLQNKDIDLSTQQLDRLDFIIKNIKTIKQQTRLEYELDTLPYTLAKCTGMSV